MDNVLQVIGNTPMVRLNTIPKEEGVQCEVCKSSFKCSLVLNIRSQVAILVYSM